jgi:hypothetical protein
MSLFDCKIALTKIDIILMPFEPDIEGENNRITTTFQ